MPYTEKASVYGSDSENIKTDTSTNAQTPDIEMTNTENAVQLSPEKVKGN